MGYICQGRQLGKDHPFFTTGEVVDNQSTQSRLDGTSANRARDTDGGDDGDTSDGSAEMEVHNNATGVYCTIT